MWRAMPVPGPPGVFHVAPRFSIHPPAPPVSGIWNSADPPAGSDEAEERSASVT